MTGGLAFVGVFVGTAAWICVPLIPAIRELLNPRDAGPLDAVGQDSGDLTFFADSFRQFVISGGFASSPDGTVLPDGRKVMTLATINATVDRKATGLIVVQTGGEVPPKTDCQVEVFCAGDLGIGEEVTLRAALAEGTLTLHPHASALRWVHGERALAVGDGVQLLGRATSRGVVALGRGVIFGRVLAPYILVGQASVAPGALSRDAWELEDSRPQFALARAAALLAPEHWLVDEDLVIPEGHVFRGSLVVRGSLRIGRGCEIRGSVKSHKTLTLESGAVVAGAAASRGDIVLREDSRVYGPVISEGQVTLASRARVGLPNMPASVSAERIELHEGAEIFGSLSARLEGLTMA